MLPPGRDFSDSGLGLIFVQRCWIGLLVVQYTHCPTRGIDMKTTIQSTTLELVQGDITQLGVDGMVTAANAQLRGGGGVDGAIHRACGPGLLDACRAIGGCQTGSAVITQAFDLEQRGVRYIIHAVGPIWQGGHNNEPVLLHSAYQTSLHLANTHDCRSIAFPSIATGVYAYPLQAAANIAVAACREFVSNTPNKLQRIVFSLFDQETYQAFSQAIEKT